MSQDSRLSLWMRWVLANALAELTGLGGTLAIGIALFSQLGEPQNALQALALGLLMTSSGLLEGALVGLLQWSVLRRPFAALSRRAWLAATIAGALVAWFLGSIPMTLASLNPPAPGAPASEPPAQVMLLLEIGMGAAAGLVLASPQWLVLRRLVAGAWLWLPANSAAWALGMPVVFAAVDLAGKAGSLAATIALAAGAIALTGALVGAVHGLALVKLATQPRARAVSGAPYAA